MKPFIKKLFLLLLLSVSARFSGAQKSISALSDDSVYTVVDVQASFPGGYNNFLKFIETNLRYPVKAFLNHAHGKVYVQFIIKKDGVVSNVVIIRSVSPEIDSETLRVMRLSPKWIPAMQNGSAVATMLTLPVTFNIQSSTINMTNDLINVKGDSAKHTHHLSDDETLNQPVHDGQPVKTFDDDQIFTAVQVQPQFPGGTNGFADYIKENQQHTNDPGRVIAQFVVEKDGTISNIKILRSHSDTDSAEAARLLKKSPKWTPGVQNGRMVRCYYTVPITLAN